MYYTLLTGIRYIESAELSWSTDPTVIGWERSRDNDSP